MLNKQRLPGYRLEKMLQKAIVLLQQGKLDKAEKQYKFILKKHPKHPDALHLSGIVFNRKGNAQKAIKAIKKAISIDQSISGYHFNLGVVYQGIGMLEEAIGAYEKSLILQPKNAGVWSNLGSALQQLERYQTSIGIDNKTIDIKLTQLNENFHQDKSYLKQGLFEQAIKCYQEALKIDRSNQSASANLGNLYKETGQIDKALDTFVYALHEDKNETELAEIRWNQATAFLMQGRFREGWIEYEWGLGRDDRRTTLQYLLPVWKGADLKNKHLLILAEQGVGDEIMFSSCLKDVIGQAKKVIVECDSRLVPLFKRSFPSIETRLKSSGADEMLEEGDYQLAIGSLPSFYRNHESEFPIHTGYLIADTLKKQLWEKRFQQLGEGLKVGISWKGGKDQDVRQRRSTVLSQHWMPLLNIKGIHFINLQYGDCKQELQTAEQQTEITIHHWDDADPIKDLDNFASQVAALDLVISVDNTTVHMAGSLGVPTWMLLPYAPDWRWQRDRTDTPWYPSVKLIRQSSVGGWDKVFKIATEKLEALLKGGDEFNAKTNESAIKVIVINDTSAWYHWGCTCTSSVIIEQLQERGFSVSTIPTNELYDCNNAPQQITDFDSEIFCQSFVDSNAFLIQRITEADRVVINGEGTLHNVSPFAMTLLYIAYISKLGMNKPVHIINHSCYPEDSIEITDAVKNGLYKKVYQQMDSVAVREIGSAGLLGKLGLDVIPSFNCLPLYIQKHNIFPEKNKTKNIIIAGSVSWDKPRLPILVDFMQKMHKKGFIIQVLTGARAFPATDDIAFIEALKNQSFKNWQLISAETENEWLNAIGGARLLVSGRFHHSIAAAFLNTPFIALNSNTPKMDGLMKMLNLSPPIPYAADDFLEKMTVLATDLLASSNTSLLAKDRADELRELAMANFISIDVDNKKA